MRINYLIAFIVSLWTFIDVQAQTKTLKGVVVDQSKSPIPGASVKLLGTTQGTSTDANGAFTLNYTEGASLQVSALGYQSQEISLTSQTQLTITLEDDNQALNEVVVTALGIKREKRQLTYSTQEVSGTEITKTKEPNVLNALTGKVSGVQITSSSGQPGSSSRIVIRGTSSLSGNNEALIVVDGVPINNSQTGDNGS